MRTYILTVTEYEEVLHVPMNKNTICCSLPNQIFFHVDT